MELQLTQQQQSQNERHNVSIGALFNLVIYVVSLLLILLQTMFGLFQPFMTTRYVTQLLPVVVS